MPTQSPILEIDIGSATYELEATQSKLALKIEDKDDKGSLLVSQDMTLDLSQLANIETALGQSQRLFYLGYFSQLFATSLTSIQEDSVSAALATFQEDLGIEATGLADKSTQTHLKTIFGA